MTVRLMRIASLDRDRLLARASFSGDHGAGCWLDRGLLLPIKGDVYEGQLLFVTFDGADEPVKVRPAKTA